MPQPNHKSVKTIYTNLVVVYVRPFQKRTPESLHRICLIWLWKDEVPKWVVEFHVECEPLRRAGLDLWRVTECLRNFQWTLFVSRCPHFQGTTSVCIRPSCAVSIERCILPGAVACGRWVRSVLCCVASVAYATSRALYPPTYANRTFCTRCCNQSFWWGNVVCVQ